ncbi:RING-H2 finger protein ATL75 [Arabidopsis thaliana]|jgi:E3 ubiquitin-protein ligase ATL10/75/76/77/78|uniref:E3 ubiquitin-protein ligase ATL76 n=4 Tax=Arabidopsis TaxID=3701 RepID=ATL76_ARATH|nr:RING/U-box superfamily protein [Arabidopsis thaliana]Q6NML0.1 RecName: Full=E3 ubiquitin-protein ligase ATL76; AltName: Full=RING-H2 finger protein ATL76; AltName: Full=RING-type E3 ubiquitin transferase ATL76 [Arabidopsis thaliana]KAG7649031.1 Zinc finger RING-type [Arabidopsis thaliana x Arabidopsis arenosa]KAG7656923.1 Zinc finger RING-type [Arabidopsis suecica]AAR24710.1 At1g49210 [Arabidopsis thaliana]AAS47653.1 At1g49210 [Arabidopsis thaliana]AAZ14074.1 At1g49210 [Arabidopsis thalian|eukprot:NP_175347.1 RING/U-box superfamily protein [Arabidopsis thaliana]
MSANELPASAQSLQEQFLGSFVTRKLLLHDPFDHNSLRVFAVAPSPLITHENNLKGNVLMLLSVLICGIICCLGLHYIIRCAFRRSSRFMISEPISSLSTPRSSSNKGIKKKALRMFPVVSYSREMNLPGIGEECVICLSDFVSGEQLRLLPKCNHGFHVRCIDKWLQHHLTCPKCRHCLVETCQKILGDFSQADSMASTPTESVIVRIDPLEPEGRVNTFRESS